MTKEEQQDRENLRYKRALKRKHQRQRKVKILIGLFSILCMLTLGIIMFLPKLARPKVELLKVMVPDWVKEELLPVNEYSRPGTVLEQVNGIVVHYVANPGTTAEQNNNYFKNLAKQSPEGATYNSSHFIIGIDGTIIQNVPLSEIAYCSNKRNEDTISIELCHPDETGEFTEETYLSLVRLTTWLSKELGVKNQDIIRHYDVTGKSCPKYFVENEDKWELFKKEVKAAMKQ